MATLKGIPSTYNKDLQEDKEALFSSVDVLNCMFVVITRALETLKVNNRKCAEALSSDMLATDVAYYLVRKGVSIQSVKKQMIKFPLSHDQFLLDSI